MVHRAVRVWTGLGDGWPFEADKQRKRVKQRRSLCQGPVACLEVMAGSQEGTEGAVREEASAGQEVGRGGSR